MRAFVLSLFLSIAAAVSVSAQIAQVPTPAPTVDASSQPWLVNAEPIIVDSETFYFTGPTVFFDGEVMTKTGEYKGVPVYQDRTLEPSSIVYVPVGGNVMRPYERRRTGDLAGTVGSRTPSFPGQTPDAVQSTPESSNGQDSNLAGAPAAVIVASAAAQASAPAPGTVSTPARASLESVPPPAHRKNGMYIVFAGARWYNSGPTKPYSPDAFVPIGRYYGRVVYREMNGPSDPIWVPVVADGPLAPYSKR